MLVVRLPTEMRPWLRVIAFQNVKSWKREMNWTHSLQIRSAVQSVHTRMRTRSQATVHARMCALRTCPNCIASCLQTKHQINNK